MQFAKKGAVQRYIFDQRHMNPLGADAVRANAAKAFGDPRLGTHTQMRQYKWGLAPHRHVRPPSHLLAVILAFAALTDEGALAGGPSAKALKDLLSDVGRFG